MTSHPKDATQKLFETMAECEKVAPCLHLPVQAGNDRVLRAMNRGYTAEQYLDKIRRLRELIPDIVLTSDIIVGFPGETTAEFEDTPAAHRGGGLRRPVHLYLFPRGHAGGQDGRRADPGGEERQFPAAAGAAK